MRHRLEREIKQTSYWAAFSGHSAHLHVPSRSHDLSRVTARVQFGGWGKFGPQISNFGLIFSRFLGQTGQIQPDFKSKRSGVGGAPPPPGSGGRGAGDTTQQRRHPGDGGRWWQQHQGRGEVAVRQWEHRLSHRWMAGGRNQILRPMQRGGRWSRSRTHLNP
jgi:hypothetical protein